MINVTETGAWNYNETDYNENHYMDAGVANYIAKLIGNNSILLDFGCGSGYYLKHIQSKLTNNFVIGVEPYATEHKKLQIDNIVSKDLTEDFELPVKGNVMCIEVLEHVPAHLESKAVENVIKHCNNYLVISWAKVGQGGIGHVNCKNLIDVVALFESKGFNYLEKESVEIRNCAHLWWLKNNLCIFKK